MGTFLNQCTKALSQECPQFLEDATENDRPASQLARLGVQVDTMADKVRQMDERISKLKTGDRLYLHKGSDEAGTFTNLKALIRGK